MKEEVFRGTVKRVTFRNTATGYHILKVQSEDGIKTVVGSSIALKTKDKIEACGIWITSPKYGEQFKARTLIRENEGRSKTADIIKSLVALGITQLMSGRIAEKFGDNSLELVKNNPYQLITDINGIGFIKADEIAQKVGVEPNNPSRIMAGVLHGLREANQTGHCYLPEVVLIEKVTSLLGLSNVQLINATIADVQRANIITKVEDSIYLTSLYAAESRVVEHITARALRIPMAGRSNIHGPRPSDITLSTEQEGAIEKGLSHFISVITGGPGYGKTTLVNTLASIARESGLEVILGAPTGRAAQKLSQVCGMQARTIHRILGYNPGTGRFMFNKFNPLSTDLVIIDEASMIDIEMAADLLEAIPQHAKIVFVGDRDQLPSVGPGRFFGDIVTSPVVLTTQLTKLYRRGEGSDINSIAQEINEGIVPESRSSDMDNEVIFSEEDDIEMAALNVVKWAKYASKLGDFLVLSPQKNGAMGVIELNKKLQDAINPSNIRVEIGGDYQLGLNDLVVQRTNDYEIHQDGVFNGDFGRITQLNADAKTAHVLFWDGREVYYNSKSISQLDLAYCITIHRSQGSEVPTVILALHTSHYHMLERQLLYTAVTRAKNKLILVGSPRALQFGISRCSASKRYCSLKERLDATAIHVQDVSNSPNRRLGHGPNGVREMV